MKTLFLRDIDRWLWPVAVPVAGALSWVARRRRPQVERALILRPGGMGDLILLCVAIEELGLDVRQFGWLIERRSSPWAAHLGLDFTCYDQTPLQTQWRLAGRYATVINSEQRYGLSQVTALLARGRGGTLVCFDTNLGARMADRTVAYDPYEAHEAVEFARLVAAALGREARGDVPVRRRHVAPATFPVVGLGGLESQTRRLSEDSWLRIIRAWSRGRRIHVVAAPPDREFGRRLCALLDGTAALFEGDFEAVCDLVRRSEEALTIDSGFMHIASYYGVPTTTIFTSSREKKWASLAAGSHVIRRTDLACQPCALYAIVPPCPHGFVCREVEFTRDLR